MLARSLASRGCRSPSAPVRQVITPTGWTDRQSGQETATVVQRDLTPPPHLPLSVSIRPGRTRGRSQEDEATAWRCLLEDETKTGQRTPAGTPVCNGCIYTCNYTRLHQFVHVGPRLVWTTGHQKLLPVCSPGWTVAHEVSSLF